MAASYNISSFLLRFTPRIWRDAQGEPHFQWRGQIRHVQGDEQTGFTHFAEAVRFMQQQLAQLTLDMIPGGDTMEQEQVIRESFKLWEQFATTYSDMMFESFERALKQSDALRQQMHEAVEQSIKAWQLPLRSDQDRIAETLARLQAQVQALSEKVDSLEKALNQQKE